MAIDEDAACDLCGKPLSKHSIWISGGGEVPVCNTPQHRDQVFRPTPATEEDLRLARVAARNAVALSREARFGLEATFTPVVPDACEALGLANAIDTLAAYVAKFVAEIERTRSQSQSFRILTPEQFAAGRPEKVGDRIVHRPYVVLGRTEDGDYIVHPPKTGD